MEKQYAERDAYELDAAGGYYCRHVSAMTREGLHSKGDIAAELGHRDMLISGLLEALQELVSSYDDFRARKGKSEIPQANEIIKARAAIAKALGKE